MKSRHLSIVDMMKKTGQWSGVKSVSTPSAQSAGSCAPDTETEKNFFIFQTSVVGNNSLSTSDKAVIELQFLCGARISEILDITSSDISRTGLVRIRAKKGSQDRIVNPIYYRDFWLRDASALLPLSSVFSRFYFYRLYKKNGFAGYFGNNSKRSVTHFFRHIRGAEINRQWHDLELVKNSLGQKSVRSASYYGKKERK